LADSTARMDREKDYLGIRRSIVGLVILVSFTPLLLMMAVVGYEFHTAYRSKVLDYLVEMLEKDAQAIDGFLNERLADIRLLSSLYSFEELSDADSLAELLQTLQERHGGVFVDLGLVNDQGTQVAYAGPFKLGEADYGHAEWFKQAMDGQYCISDVFLGLRGLPHFVVAVKSDSPRMGGGAWILRATIDFVAFNQLVEDVRLGKTGLAFIINRDGQFQTRPRIDLSSYTPVLQDFIWQSIPHEEQRPRSEADDWASVPNDRSEVARRMGIFTGLNPASGRAAVYVTMLMKDDSWALVYQQDESDAYASLYRARNISLAVCLLGGIAIIFIASVLSKRVAERIARGDRARDLMNDKVIEAGRLASIGELAAGVAHEINNPVAIMVEESGWIEDLLEDEEFSETESVREISRAVKQIQTQGKRCKGITQQLLHFARKIDPEEKEVQLNDLVREIKDLSEQRAKYNNIKFELDLAAGLPPLALSPSEIPQVLLNLINNAIDAIDHKQGGKVTLATRVEGGEVVLEVADTGEGIPEANLKRIFDPFFTTKAVGKGTGLGLSICHGIITKLGGSLTVDSTVGVGSTFHIRFPESRRSTGRPAAADEASTTNSRAS